MTCSGRRVACGICAMQPTRLPPHLDVFLRAFRFRHSFVIRHSSFVIFRGFTGPGLPVYLCPLSLHFTALAFRFQNFSFERRWSRRFAPALFFASGNIRTSRGTLPTLNRIEQSFAREFPILRLRPRILHGHANSAWPMTQRHRRGNLVYVLPARSAGPRERFHKIDIANAELLHSIAQ